ncbi:hypothetical protein N7505_004159, partial [Penicillium chrysogenum]
MSIAHSPSHPRSRDAKAVLTHFSWRHPPDYWPHIGHTPEDLYQPVEDSTRVVIKTTYMPGGNGSFLVRVARTKGRKTYNSEDSLVVTHPTTNSPACGLCAASSSVGVAG